MATDLSLSEIDIPARALTRLKGLEIHGVRQLYARLQRDGESLRLCMGLSGGEFAALLRQLDATISALYPEDKLPHVHPTVDKSGVAVDRLDDPNRPRYGGRSGARRR